MTRFLNISYAEDWDHFLKCFPRIVGYFCLFVFFFNGSYIKKPSFLKITPWGFSKNKCWFGAFLSQVCNHPVFWACHCTSSWTESSEAYTRLMSMSEIGTSWEKWRAETESHFHCKPSAESLLMRIQFASMLYTPSLLQVPYHSIFPLACESVDGISPTFTSVSLITQITSHLTPLEYLEVWSTRDCKYLNKRGLLRHPCRMQCQIPVVFRSLDRAIGFFMSVAIGLALNWMHVTMS